MEEQTDKSFIKNMVIILVLLIVVTVSIIYLARDAGYKEYMGDNPSREAIALERIKPVASVYTEESEITAAGEVTAAPATTAPEQAAASVAAIDGEKLYAAACSACHSTGAAGAPKLGSPEMAERAKKGMDAMVQNALNGINAMPARGGRADLSDEQIQTIVEFMLQ